MSRIVKNHIPCISSSCGSSDAMTIYQNEEGLYNAYCYSCETWFNEYELGDTDLVPKKAKQDKVHATSLIDRILTYPITSIPERGISKEAAEHFGIRVSYNEQTREIEYHYYPYYRDGELVGFKYRHVPTKEFQTVGNIKGAEPFGWNSIRGNRYIIITEGECDAAAVWDMLKAEKKNYNVVSVANSATVKQHLDKLQRFDTVVLAYDQDKAGKLRTEADAKRFEPGQVRVVKYKEYKDPNEILLKDTSKFFLNALYSAKEYRPDGIVRLSQCWEELFAHDSIESIPFPWKGLNDKLYGLRPREILTLTAGSGSGKSAVCREIQYDLFHKIPKDENIGILALEENVGRTAWGLMAIEANKPLHIREERVHIKDEEFRHYFNATVGTDRFVAYDHFGSTSTGNLLDQIRYMIKAMDCKWIFLDHLSIVVSDMEETGDERRTIDTIMTKLRQLTEETGACLINVVHLRRSSGDKGHEQGGEVSLNQLRGSHSIAHLSDSVVALERNQQAEDDTEANLTLLRVLKNRYAGLVGPAGYLWYDRNTGRLQEIDDKDEFIAAKQGY